MIISELPLFHINHENQIIKEKNNGKQAIDRPRGNESSTDGVKLKAETNRRGSQEGKESETDKQSKHYLQRIALSLEPRGAGGD